MTRMRALGDQARDEIAREEEDIIMCNHLFNVTTWSLCVGLVAWGRSIGLVGGLCHLKHLPKVGEQGDQVVSVSRRGSLLAGV